MLQSDPSQDHRFVSKTSNVLSGFQFSFVHRGKAAIVYVDDSDFPTLESDRTGNRAFKQKLITLGFVLYGRRLKILFILWTFFQMVFVCVLLHEIRNKAVEAHCFPNCCSVYTNFTFRFVNQNDLSSKFLQ
ncbi:hypothetical protein DKX38_006684 [Salix brachista]|uniref:Uncharacterized protein n=1 Tax=Salix brachista TaxID=2182728 RepID=A0A5N5N2X0_9ROSI|nr:hypothetical protein DKX38_006684 [Salix brachista]